ncbi:MAG: ATP-binding protein [Marinilabiliales bacterium]|nr:ATP-binding protein [Marinilabiliales bacterium]
MQRATTSRPHPFQMGQLTIFALIIALYFEEKPFIIIEEPVSHIHPFLVARVIAMMKESSKRKQVMITTHTTEVVKHAISGASSAHFAGHLKDFSVISRPADKEEVQDVSGKRDRDRGTLCPEPAGIVSMKNRLFILVEGEDDVRFFGRIIKPLLVSAAMIQLRLSRMQASNAQK